MIGAGQGITSACTRGGGSALDEIRVTRAARVMRVVPLESAGSDDNHDARIENTNSIHHSAQIVLSIDSIWSAEVLFWGEFFTYSMRSISSKSIGNKVRITYNMRQDDGGRMINSASLFTGRARAGLVLDYCLHTLNLDVFGEWCS